jgi:hypothetical protein
MSAEQRVHEIEKSTKGGGLAAVVVVADGEEKK